MKRHLALFLATVLVASNSIAFATDANSSASNWAGTTTTKPATTSKPVTAPKPATVVTVSNGEKIHTVASGETLAKIAAKYSTTYQKIADRNKLSNPHMIFVGQKLVIPTKTEVTATATTKPVTPKPEVKPEVKPNVDTISSSSQFFYNQGTWAPDSQEYKNALLAPSDFSTQIVSTVNADGTPNAAVFPIRAVSEDNLEYLAFINAGSNTLQNLKERKTGVLTWLRHRPEEFPRENDKADPNNKYNRNQGMRLVVELVEDQAKIAELKAIDEKYKDERYVFLKVVKQLPLG